jgi:hypothetical protein
MHIKYYLEKLKEKEANWEKTYVDGRIILKWIKETKNSRVYTGFN